jgi:hypothetical protein
VKGGCDLEGNSECMGWDSIPGRRGRWGVGSVRAEWSRGRELCSWGGMTEEMGGGIVCVCCVGAAPYPGKALSVGGHTNGWPRCVQSPGAGFSPLDAE